MNTVPTDVSEIERRIARSALLIAALMVVGSGAGFRSWQIPFFVLLGALLAWLNFRWLGEGISAVILPANTKRIKYLVVKFLLRLVLILGVLYVIIRVSVAGAMGLVAGLSIYVLSMMLEALRSLFRTGKSHAGT